MGGDRHKLLLRLRALVRSGAYTVDLDRLAAALLDGLQPKQPRPRPPPPEK